MNEDDDVDGSSFETRAQDRNQFDRCLSFFFHRQTDDDDDNGDDSSERGQRGNSGRRRAVRHILFLHSSISLDL